VGGGTLTLSGVNTFTGPVTISAGRMMVNSSAPAVNLTGGVLGGTGTVGALSLAAGTVEPGAVGAVGTLTATTAIFGAGSSLVTDIGAGTSADLLAVTGALDLSAGGAVLNLVGSESLFDGSTKTIATYSSISGTFSNVTLNGAALAGSQGAFVVNGNTYAVEYGTGAITLSAAVPEPGVAGLGLAGGLVGLTRRRR
jgi:fibronectin-binding autotransporter adhesin